MHTRWIDFPPFPNSAPRAAVCVSEICVMKSHFLCVVVCQLELNLHKRFPPSLFLTLFLFYLRFLFLLACSTCLLCTTFCYYFLLLPQFLALVYDLLFVLTKPNWTFSSLFFFFSSGLEDCCCLVLLFSFFAPCCAMCTCDVMRLRKWVWVRAWAIASLSRACFDGNGLFLSASAPAWLCVSESLMGDF